MLTEELPACTYSREKGDVSDDDEKLDARASSVWLLLRGSTKAADRVGVVSCTSRRGVRWGYGRGEEKKRRVRTCSLGVVIAGGGDGV